MRREYSKNYTGQSLKISILAETREFDIKCYQLLVRKVFNEYFKSVKLEIIETSVEVSPKGKLIKQLPQLIDAIAITDLVDLIFLFVDCDNLKPNEQRTEILKQMKKINDFPLSHIVIGLPKRNIESWLIADITTIKNLGGISIRSDLSVEEAQDPKSLFQSIYKHSGMKQKMTDFACKIIDCMDIEKLLKRSTTFGALLDDINTKLKEIKSAK